jgi:hypothetical protein
MHTWRGINAAIFIAGLCALAQQPRQVRPASTPAGHIIKPVERPMPFSVDGPGQSAQPIEFRAADQVSAQDRLLIANAQSSIAESAGYSGLDFEGGGQWSYEQIVCPALPNHIFLRFLRNDGARDVSMFTASIPRDQQGRVRIVPIRNRGYSLWSPAPINALTIAAFNHIRLEEDPAKTPVSDWTGTGLCYAALAGGHPRLGVISSNPEKEKYPVDFTASLQVPEQGGGIVSFSDVNPLPDQSQAGRPVEWTMDFNGQGKLLKVTRTSAPLFAGDLYLHPQSPRVEKAQPRPVTLHPRVIDTTKKGSRTVPVQSLPAHTIPPSPMVERPSAAPPGQTT